MNLNDEQKILVAQWVKEGCGLSELQRRLADQFKMNLTYMDVRFLMIELGVVLQDKQKATSPVKDMIAPASPTPSRLGTEPGDADANDPADEPLPGSGGVSVDVDRIVRPGAMVSGTVVFSDGVKATWTLDQMGRLALGGADKSYRPSAQDVQEFQVSIARELRKRGYG